MNRAASRRRGKRIEAKRKAVKLLARAQGKMWRKLNDDYPTPRTGYSGDYDPDLGYYYCPYVPISISESGVIPVRPPS